MMRIVLKHAAILLGLMSASPAFTQADASYELPTVGELANQQLPDPEQEAIARALMVNLRCIQCQGQSIADSDAPIAGAMRGEVRRRIAKGESPVDVRLWLTSRYGDWVSFEPPMFGSGLLLWLMPAFLIFIALCLAHTVFAEKEP
jgi:cytochrome c-type biogenesis protein CcmH